MSTGTAQSTLFDPDDRSSLFGQSVDLWIFGGSAVASMLLLVVGRRLGILDGDAPTWVWLLCIVGVDVAHVWATVLRVYFDGQELRRRPLLYGGVPLVCYVTGVAVHTIAPMLFWRVLAYAAVFHFVRQQAGWVRLYHRRAPETTRTDRVLDASAIYAATLYPLLHWHGHLPRDFAWFMQGDFIRGVSAHLSDALEPVYWLVLLVFCLRRILMRLRGEALPIGTTVVVLTTWACWHLGVITYASDYAFTVTNVLIHGVPYFALTIRYGRMRGSMGAPLLARLTARGVAPVLLLLVSLALAEESLWERYIWHDHPWLAGVGTTPSGLALSLLVALLALPQAAHYVLDGVIWRGRHNPLLQTHITGHPSR